MRVLSLGAGVQSSTLLLMMCRGEIEPVDCAIFADTQWEPKAVYGWLDEVLEPEAEKAGIPIYRVTAGNIRADALRKNHRFASMPVFVKSPSGEGEGMSKSVNPQHVCGTCVGWQLVDNPLMEEFVYRCQNPRSPLYRKQTVGEDRCGCWRILRELQVVKW